MYFYTNNVFIFIFKLKCDSLSLRMWQGFCNKLILLMMVFKNVKNAHVPGPNKSPEGWNSKGDVTYSILGIVVIT